MRLNPPRRHYALDKMLNNTRFQHQSVAALIKGTQGVLTPASMLALEEAFHTIHRLAYVNVANKHCEPEILNPQAELCVTLLVAQWVENKFRNVEAPQPT
jgi:hypothetical protein